MNVTITHADAVNLVRGTQPNYTLFNDSRLKALGSFSGSYGTWCWSHGTIWNGYTTEQLWQLYNDIKNAN